MTGPRNPCYAVTPKSEQILFEGRNHNRFSSKTKILSSFTRKEMNTKVEHNFVAHNLDSEFALFDVRTWEIWRQQGRAANQENLDEADFMETKFASLLRRISCKARWSTPQGTPRT
jgi:hypothetical protein